MKSFLQNARHRWRSAFFELIVARTLQALGATLKTEEPNETGRRPDFTATFADVPIVVEAVSPVFNAEAGEKIKTQKPLLEIIEEHKPDDVRCAVWKLPNIGLADSKKEFKTAIKSIFSTLPDSLDDGRLDIVKQLSNGDIHITILPGKSKLGRVAIEPIIAVIGNCVDRIGNAVKEKKNQVRDSEVPVLLAIEAPEIWCDLEDFDMALFGQTFERVDLEGRTVGTGFDASGIFASRRTDDPTYAGVLAFPGVGFKKCSDPVLYLHPRFRGSLPSVLAVLECHSYNRETNRIEIRESSANIMKGLNFVKEP
ncbi:MAG: hypothetical protein DYH05_04360 [Acidobacteria bacterium ACB1]|nr:hypothetical protein [Acidobacteria bacterium ACB1]RIJ95239.1 MAG: hypothetical protein DCC44_02595 [Acidobacteriota bacterium]